MSNRSKDTVNAFTLVEIMIVVVVIGLLAAMAIPAFNKARYTSRYTAIENNLRQISAAAQQYMMEQGVYQVAESQLEGTSSFNYIRPLAIVNGETYSGFTAITGTMTQLSTSQSDGTPVIYNL